MGAILLIEDDRKLHRAGDRAIRSVDLWCLFSRACRRPRSQRTRPFESHSDRSFTEVTRRIENAGVGLLG